MQIVVNVNDISYSEKHYSDIEDMNNRILIDYSNAICDCFIIIAGFKTDCCLRLKETQNLNR